jgi:hypothetical protein
MEAAHKASCHCGRIQVVIAAEFDEVIECNCSLCRRSGFLHWYVLPEQVRLLTANAALDLLLALDHKRPAFLSHLWHCGDPDLDRVPAARLDQRALCGRC